MTTKYERVHDLPEEFASYEEAAEFWDTHDTTDYLDSSHPVKVLSVFKKRHYSVEIDAVVVESLRRYSKKKGVSLGHLVSDLLRQQLAEMDNAAQQSPR
jgi:hypothetical protein